MNIVSAVRKLQSVDEYTHGSMEFLRSFVYALGTDDLVPSGALQCVIPKIARRLSVSLTLAQILRSWLDCV